MTNVFAVLFQVLAVVLAIKAARAERKEYASLLLSGLAFALALSTRWTTLFAALMIAVVLVGLRGRRLFSPAELLASAVSFVALPPLVYVASYLPIVTLRPGLQPWHHLRELWALQVEVWNYHAHLQATHPYFSKWWTWPWLYRPTWYFFESVEGWVRGIIAIGNPLVWWFSVPVTLWALVTGVMKRDRARLFAGIGFCCLYLPWGISPRTLNYSHYLFEAIPYACLALGLLLDELWDGKWAQVARIYVGVVVLWFLVFSPLLIGWPVPAEWFGAHLWSWFPSWI
jgi:dolichyl-phosphate-mannose-protein mannosyltransferase